VAHDAAASGDIATLVREKDGGGGGGGREWRDREEILKGEGESGGKGRRY
jgi:hypothetical protein